MMDMIVRVQNRHHGVIVDQHPTAFPPRAAGVRAGAPRADVPSVPDIDRVRIAEAFRLADAVQDKIWPGWSSAPFAVLLVTPKYEYLMRHPNPTSDFTLIGYDSVLKEKVWYRERQYAVSFLATFPAVDGLPTVVIGEAEYTTSKTSTPWVVTLLHEHFHQTPIFAPGLLRRRDRARARPWRQIGNVECWISRSPMRTPRFR